MSFVFLATPTQTSDSQRNSLTALEVLHRTAASAVETTYPLPTSATKAPPPVEEVQSCLEQRGRRSACNLTSHYSTGPATPPPRRVQAQPPNRPSLLQIGRAHV